MHHHITPQYLPMAFATPVVEDKTEIKFAGEKQFMKRNLKFDLFKDITKAH